MIFPIGSIGRLIELSQDRALSLGNVSHGIAGCRLGPARREQQSNPDGNRDGAQIHLISPRHSGEPPPEQLVIDADRTSAPCRSSVTRFPEDRRNAACVPAKQLPPPGPCATAW